MIKSSIFSDDKSQIKIKEKLEFLFYYRKIFKEDHIDIKSQKIYHCLNSFEKKTVLLSNLIVVAKVIKSDVVFQIKSNNLSEIFIVNCKGMKNFINNELKLIKMDKFEFVGKMKKSVGHLPSFLEKLDSGRITLSTVYKIFEILNCELEVYISPTKD